MFAHNVAFEDAVHFSRFDKDSPFSTVSNHPFLLEEVQWKTAEHYYQACKFKGLIFSDQIIIAADGEAAYELGNKWLKRKVSGWKKSRQLYMTRALYRKVKEYPEIQQALIETGDNLLLEISQYDYFWGIGRDQRGENTLGKVWMGIRKKLIDEADDAPAIT